MMETRWTLVGLIVVFGLVVGSGCQSSVDTDVDRAADGTVRLGAVEAVDTLSRAVAPSDRPLRIDGIRGAVAIRGDTTATADLSFIRRGRGADPDDARATLDGISVEESGSEETYTYTLESSSQTTAYAAVDVAGTVPRATALQIEKTSGPVTIDGVEGALTVRQSHGPVTLRGTAGPVDVSVQNGSLSVGVQALPSDASVTLETDNGDVTVAVPPEASARLDARTNAGTLRAQGLSLSNERFDPVDAGGRYRADVGDGDALIEVRVKNGDIRFRAADTTATMPAPDTLSVPPSDTTVAPSAPADSARPDTAETDPDTTEADAP
ncbi:MAG: DUF4097 family beta strand repeat-containing protein [Salinibacter sp.]